MSNHFVLPGQKDWRAFPNKCCRLPIPRPSFVFEKRPEQPDGDSDWVSSRQSGYSFALKVANPCWESSPVYVWTGTYCGWTHYLNIISPSFEWNSHKCSAGGGVDSINSPPPPLTFDVFFHQAYKMFLCGFACLHPPLLLRLQQMEPWDGGYLPSRSPLDRNSLSTIRRGPKRPAICLLLLVQRWDISNRHLLDVYSACHTLSLVSVHILCPRSRCEETQRRAPINNAQRSHLDFPLLNFWTKICI